MNRNEPPHLRHNDLTCGACGYQMDTTTNVTGQRAPCTGDVVLCGRCAAVWLFEVSPLGIVALREPTIAELTDFDPQVIRAARLLAVLNATDPQSPFRAP
jgi:hypothetical protein